MSDAVPPQPCLAGAPPQLASAAPDPARAVTVFVMLVVILYFGKEVLVPITLALLLSFLLSPLVNLLRRLHLGRVPSVLLAVIIAIGILIALGGVIGSQIGDIAHKVPQYSKTVEAKVSSVRRYTVHEITHLSEALSRQGLKPAPAAKPAASPSAVASGPVSPAQPSLSGAPPAAPTAAAPPQQVEMVQARSSPVEMIRRYLSPILSPLATFGIVFVVTIFALLQKEDLRDKMIRLVGSSDMHRTTVAIDDGASRLSRYFLTQLSVNSSFGCVIGVGLYFIGVPNPILFGIFTALLRFVPYIGSLLSALLPMGLAAAVTPGWGMVIETAALYLVLEGVTGNFIEPMIYGHSTGLSPFTVIVAAIFWSWLWGPIGLILSTPLTLCLVVMGRHSKQLEFLDILLGDRPALTPVESFYQRILANDADEAEDQAELLLKDRSLSTYYDEVALKGLQLAANDAEQGLMKREQLDRVRDTVRFVIEGLDRHDDSQPKGTKPEPASINAPQDDKAAPGRALPRNPSPDGDGPSEADLPPEWQTEAPVLCLAGRGPLDEAAAMMLAQLLEKHEIGARMTSHQSASREGIGSLDVEGVAMVCISYLDISGSPAHLRYLMQRLRRRLPPGTPILVGLWPADDETLKDNRTRTIIGADYYTSSLREAVNACLDVARRAAAAEPEPASAPAKTAESV